MRKAGSTRRAPPRTGGKPLAWAASAAALLTTSCGSAPINKEALPPRPPVANVVMREYRFEHQRSIPSGRVVFRGHNAGRKRHELLLLSLPEDLPPIDVQLRSKRRRGLPTLGYLHPVRPRASDAFAADLVPGRYALICFLEDGDGESRALKGMSSEFRVR